MEAKFPSTPTGGLRIAWLLGDVARTVALRDGSQKTIIELRDPSRLSSALVLWLDGPSGALADLAPGSVVDLHVASVRGGRARGELIGTVDRQTVEAAFARASVVAK